MKHSKYWLIAGSMVFLLLSWSCEGPDQPSYGGDNPDPNPTGGAAATITSVVPSEALPGETIVIMGSGFDPLPENNFVSLGPKAATILSCTQTQIQVLVPPYSGPVKVKVGVKGAELWSNELDFVYKSFIPDITDPEAVIIDSTISWPNGVAVDDDDNVYIGSANDGVIYKITPAGDKSEFVSLPVQGHIHFGPEGYLYVCEKGESMIVRVSPDGGNVEDVVEVGDVVDFDWDEDGNMYMVSGDYGLYMMPAGGGDAVELAGDLGSVKNCRVFGGYVYISKIWESQITRFEIIEGGVGEEEVYFEADTPSSFDFDINGTMYWASAWEISLFVYAPGGAEEAVIYEEELMTPMRYMLFHKDKIYVVYPGWADIGQTMSVYIGVQQAPRYGRE